MRIVGGTLRGRTLAPPRSHAVRPTADKLRQILFDIVAHGHGDRLADTRVLDLFAGTGALGLEALSRGAGFALFVEQDAEARAVIRRNVEALGLTGRARIFRRDATYLGRADPIAAFDLVFADPPYGAGLGERALSAALAGGWLAPDALLVLEESAKADIQTPEALVIVDRRRVGDSQLVFLKAM